ncbi:MAG TPA: hypothetical protein VIK91_01460 [Nannocystis sp.]
MIRTTGSARTAQDRRRVALSRLALVFALTPALLACPAGDVDTPDDDDDAGAGSSTTAVYAVVPGPVDHCVDAVVVSQGLFRGSLRNTLPDTRIGGVCGGGGPDVFVRVETAVRADLRVEARGVGFVPRLSLAPDDCLGGREIACSADGLLVLPDVAAGTVLRVAVGADPDVFSDLNKKTSSEDDPDPLAFELTIDLTRILGPGEVCEPASRGRCAVGTVCAPDPGVGAPVCTPIPADTCAGALSVPVALDAAGVGSLEIDPALPQTDAHHHRCGGAGLRERVLRLALPDAGPARALEIVAGRPDVGLAVRAPGCLADDEVACAAGGDEPARVVIGDLMGLRAAGVEPYLFVELPAGSEQDPPFELGLRLVPDSGSWRLPGG